MTKAKMHWFILYFVKTKFLCIKKWSLQSEYSNVHVAPTKQILVNCLIEGKKQFLHHSLHQFPILSSFFILFYFYNGCVSEFSPQNIYKKDCKILTSFERAMVRFLLEVFNFWSNLNSLCSYRNFSQFSYHRLSFGSRQSQKHQKLYLLVSDKMYQLLPSR